MIVYLNGRYLPHEQATVSVLDRGFIFGDGIYDVWRVVRGGLFAHERHVARVMRGLESLRIAPPKEASRRALLEIGERLLRENDLLDGEATFYVEITRGAATRTHHFPPDGCEPTVFAMASRFAPPEAIRATGAVAITVPDVRWHRCDVKTIQLLPNVLAKQEAQERGALEAIFVRDGVITEGSHCNVMAVVGGELWTHPEGGNILNGISRMVVLEMARALGIPVREKSFRLDELPLVDELFLTGTTTDVMPLIRVDDVTIGDGSPGPVTRALFAEFRRALDDAATAAAVA